MASLQTCSTSDQMRCERERKIFPRLFNDEAEPARRAAEPTRTKSPAAARKPQVKSAATLSASGTARGVNNTTGVALVEAYDLDTTVDSKLANISTRGLVQTGDNVMIGGFIALGSNPQSVIVRAIGPSLADFGVDGALADPTLELHNPDGSTLASNDNWRTTQEADIIAAGLQPTQDGESAILETLAPGAYTAIVRGVNATTGVALVEVYDLQQ